MVDKFLKLVATKNSDDPLKKVMMVDAKKAHKNPRSKEDVYIELPPEVRAEPGHSCKLNFWLYGFRKAASVWEDLCAELMEQSGFRRGVGCSVIFRHEDKDLVGVVHGDDFVFRGSGEDLKWVAVCCRICTAGKQKDFTPRIRTWTDKPARTTPLPSLLSAEKMASALRVAGS